MEDLEVFEPAVAEEEATPEPEAAAPAKGEIQKPYKFVLHDHNKCYGQGIMIQSRSCSLLWSMPIFTASLSMHTGKAVAHLLLQSIIRMGCQRHL